MLGEATTSEDEGTLEMNSIASFKCLHCGEVFCYEPDPAIAEMISRVESDNESKCLVRIRCPHCPTTLVLDRRTGNAYEFTIFTDAQLDDLLKRTGATGMCLDLTVAEKTEGEVFLLNELGCVKFNEESNVPGAEVLYRKALTIRKHDPRSWFNLGRCRQELGDLDEAEECYRHALRFDPSMVQAWNNLGTLFIFQRQFSDADACFEEGLKVNPDYPKFYLGKASVAHLTGDDTMARHYLRIALEKDPDYEPAQRFLRQLEGA